MYLLGSRFGIAFLYYATRVPILDYEVRITKYCLSIAVLSDQSQNSLTDLTIPSTYPLKYTATSIPARSENAPMITDTPKKWDKKIMCIRRGGNQKPDTNYYIDS